MSFRPVKNTSIRENLMLLALTLAAASAQAQTPPVNEPDYNRPALFSSLPDTITLGLPEIDALFQLQTGETAGLILGGGSRFEGKLISRVILPAPQRVSLVVRSTSHNGANLCITRMLQEDGSFTYTGRIISRQHIDSYTLVRLSSDNYCLRKMNYYQLVSE